MFMDIVCIDGRYMSRADAAVSPFSPALKYGLSLFETVLTSGSCPYFIEAHFARLKESSDFMEMNMTATLGEIVSLSSGLLMRNESPASARLRISLLETGSPHGDWSTPSGKSVLALELQAFEPPDSAAFERGASAAASVRGAMRDSIRSRRKTGNFLENLAERRRALRMGCGEAVLLSAGGAALEGTAANLFMVAGRAIITAPLSSGVLPGITRAQILSARRLAGAGTEEREFMLDELHAADEAFFTNSLQGVMPLTLLDGRKIGSGRPGPVSRAAADFLAGLKRRYLESFRAPA